MRLLWLAGLALLMVGCSSIESVPVKTGSDLDELRKSPCACDQGIQPRSQWNG